MRFLPALCLLCFYQAASYAIDFALPDLEGQTVRLSDYQGKWVIVNFWASWCSPCVQELPELAAFQQQHVKQVQILGLNFEGTTRAEAKAFLQQIPPTGFPHLKDSGNQLPLDFFITRDGKQLLLNGLPSTFFINPQGEVLGSHLGPLTGETLLRKLQSYGYTQ
jgi:thiol-disulfide isomerase/thioredoxin